ncbi:MAG: hypothetical protein FWE84_02200 [Firmicutes bacterium]|nr:hypothetical protein [Bacillota bacterium]
MKKVIIISLVFAAVLGAGTWEIAYSTRLFTQLEDGLILVKQSIYASGEDIANAETLFAMDRVSEKWKKGREVVFCLGNHNAFRALDEKIISLEVMVKINHADDAKVMTETALNLVRAVMNDTHPVMSNLF